MNTSNENNVTLLQKLRNESLMGSQEEETNYESKKIEPQKELLIPPNSDDFIATLIFALLRLNHFNVFLSLASVLDSDDFIDSLTIMGKMINMGNNHCVSPRYLEVVTIYISKRYLFYTSLRCKQIAYFYDNFFLFFDKRTSIDQKAVLDLFYMKMEGEQKQSDFNPGILSDKDFVDHDVSNVKKIKKHKGDSNIELLEIPKIILYVPKKQHSMPEHAF